MTDDEIVKALECCVKNDCRQCPYMAKKVDCVSLKRSENDVLNLINRQKAEIVQLTEENAHLAKLNEEKRLEEFSFSKKIVAENKELQKQVDELKAKLQCPTDITEAVKPFVNEAVKDTAEKFAERLKENAHWFVIGKIQTDHFYECLDEICKEITDGEE